MSNLLRRIRKLETRLTDIIDPLEIRIVSAADGLVIDRYLATPHGPERPWQANTTLGAESKLRGCRSYDRVMLIHNDEGDHQKTEQA
jgi:hypothetical protein